MWLPNQSARHTELAAIERWPSQEGLASVGAQCASWRIIGLSKSTIGLSKEHNAVS